MYMARWEVSHQPQPHKSHQVAPLHMKFSLQIVPCAPLRPNAWKTAALRKHPLTSWIHLLARWGYKPFTLPSTAPLSRLKFVLVVDFTDVQRLLGIVQASYSAAQRLLGGFMNSSDNSGGGGGGSDNVTKAAGFFSLRRYRSHFNVDTLVSTSFNNLSQEKRTFIL